MDLIKKYKMLTYALVLGIIFAVSSAGAADFTNSESGTINNKGTLRIKGDRNFRNAADYDKITNEGTFEFTGNGKFTDAPVDPLSDNEDGETALGKDATWRVPGKTLWSGTAAQNLQPRWYEDLSTANGGVKSFNDGSFYVSGVYAPHDGGRDYGTSNFYYDGSTAQDIVGENGMIDGNNIYYNLIVLNEGAKTVQEGQTVNVSESVLVDASATSTLTIIGVLNSFNEMTQQASAGTIIVGPNTGQLLLGKGESVFNSDVNVDGVLVTEDEGLAKFKNNLTVNTGGLVNIKSGDVLIDTNATLALATDASLDVDADRTMTVTGSFTNGDANSDNLTFDPASTVIYNGGAGQSIVKTVDTHPYGNLTVEGSGEKTPEGSVFLAGDFSLSDANLPMGDDAYVLTMLTPTSSANYTDDVELIGKMRRMYDAATDSYTMNNRLTVIDFTDDATSGDYIQLNVKPLEAPFTYDDGTDVKRKINFEYNLGGFTASIKAGYKANELPGSFADDLTENDLKFFEAEDGLSEKLAGSGYIRDVNENFKSLSLGGIQDDNVAVDGIVENKFTSGHDLVLRASNQMYSIASGRWSNPATWDEFREPTSLDNVTIANGTQVHAGGGTASDARDKYTNDETYRVGGSGDGETDNTGFVKSITIQVDAALVFGNSAFTYALATGAKITNNANGVVNKNSFSDFLNTAPGSFTGRGLIIYEGLLRSNEITNSGLLWIDENATVEVGD